MMGSADETYMSSQGAKHDYFLKPQDLATIQHFSSGTWGCGGLKLYKKEEVKQLAVSVHGIAGLEKKKLARQKREANKRKKEEEAEIAAKRMREELNQPAAATVVKTTISKTSTTVVREAKLKQLRNEIKKAFKQKCTWDYLRSKRAPNGTSGTISVPRVSKEEFAALIGIPRDPELKSLVKRGAWYCPSVDAKTLFGGDIPEICGSGGRYNCNSDLGADVENIVCKYSPSQETMSLSCEICHVDQIINFG